MMPISCDAAADAVVCVPARNEARRIGTLLASLAAQTVATVARPLKVVIVSNNSTDATADVVRGFAHEARLNIRLLDIALPPDRAHAGAARRLAMDAGAAWLEGEGSTKGVLISTDADAVAPGNWVAANLEALVRADLVGGRLVVARDTDAPAPLLAMHARIERYWAAVRALEERIDPPAHDPAPRHGDHTGASLALRAALYRAVGGVPEIPNGEDNALVSAVERAGGRVRHCPHVSIEVSARETGRADGGMAAEMVRRRETFAGAAPYLLPGADFWRARLERRAEWRAEWSLAGGDCPNAIAHVARREAGAARETPEPVPVEVATAALEAMARAPSRAVA